jgi:hypothetical protein
MRVTCPGCDVLWAGRKAEHCPACHATFSGTTTGDRHRVGAHGVTEGPERRRCLTVEEMRAVRRRDGSPFYREIRNAYGTVVWSRWETRENRAWKALGRVADVATAVPGTPR